MSDQNLTRYWNDNTHWSYKVIYKCSDDPRTFVPKKYGYGATLNFAHWESIAFMSSVGLIIGGIFASQAMDAKTTDEAEAEWANGENWTSVLGQKFYSCHSDPRMWVPPRPIEMTLLGKKIRLGKGKKLNWANRKSKVMMVAVSGVLVYSVYGWLRDMK